MLSVIKISACEDNPNEVMLTLADSVSEREQLNVYKFKCLKRDAHKYPIGSEWVLSLTPRDGLKEVGG